MQPNVTQDSKAHTEQAADASKRPYRPPSICSQAVFETTALLCSGKSEGQSLPCQFNMFS